MTNPISYDMSQQSQAVAAHVYRASGPHAKRMSLSQGKLAIQAKLYGDNKLIQKPNTAFVPSGIRVHKKKSNFNVIKRVVKKKINDTVGTMDGSMQMDNDDSLMFYS